MDKFFKIIKKFQSLNRMSKKLNSKKKENVIVIMNTEVTKIGNVLEEIENSRMEMQTKRSTIITESSDKKKDSKDLKKVESLEIIGNSKITLSNQDIRNL